MHLAAISPWWPGPVAEHREFALQGEELPVRAGVVHTASRRTGFDRTSSRRFRARARQLPCPRFPVPESFCQNVAIAAAPSVFRRRRPTASSAPFPAGCPMRSFPTRSFLACPRHRRTGRRRPAAPHSPAQGMPERIPHELHRALRRHVMLVHRSGSVRRPRRLFAAGLLLAAFSLMFTQPAEAGTPARGTAHMGMGVLAHDGGGSASRSAAAAQTEGVDVSGYQGNVAWSTLWSTASAGPIRRRRKGRTTEPLLRPAVQRFVRRRHDRGAYHFATPDTTSGATQANYFVDHGGGWSRTAGRCRARSTSSGTRTATPATASRRARWSAGSPTS